MALSKLDMAWLTKRFDELERQHGLILKKLEGGNVTPELEHQILRAMKLSKLIDNKVPDISVPPN